MAHAAKVGAEMRARLAEMEADAALSKVREAQCASNLDELQAQRAAQVEQMAAELAGAREECARSAETIEQQAAALVQEQQITKQAQVPPLCRHTHTRARALGGATRARTLATG